MINKCKEGDYAYICKPSLEKLAPKGLNKICQLFAKIIYLSIICKNYKYSGEYIKISPP